MGVRVDSPLQNQKAGARVAQGLDNDCCVFLFSVWKRDESTERGSLLEPGLGGDMSKWDPQTPGEGAIPAHEGYSSVGGREGLNRQWQPY